MDTDKISAAVAELLTTLQGEPQPLLRLAKIADGLQSRPGWTESEIWEVHARLFLLLRNLTD